MLPGIDGIELLRRMKAAPAYSNIPVVMATAKGSEYDKIQGLDGGADYYLAKPFGVMEIVSCVKAVLRRFGKTEQSALSCGGITVNPAERTAFVDGKRVELTYKEFELLKMFVSNPNVAFTRDRLFGDIWA